MNRQTDSTFKPLVAALLAALGTVPLAARAATIIVTSPNDSVGTFQTCTLRQAIVSMNVGAVTGTACSNSGGAFGSGDTITFDTDLAFPPGGGNTFALVSGQLAITDANLTIDATDNGNVTVDAKSLSRVMYDSASAAGASLTVKHLTLLNGVATSKGTQFAYKGGGICIPYAKLTLSDSTVSGSIAGLRGGGIFSLLRNVTVTNSTISGNATSEYGGGISAAFGIVTLTNSTVSGNSAINPSSSLVGGGGGIYISATGQVTLTNSTVNGNSANQYGGGIDCGSSCHFTLTNSTVSGNSSAFLFGGGISIKPGAVLVVNNSIVAGNTGLVSGSANINGSVSSGTNNLIGGNPMLGALANNGGPTMTLRPQAGSPAINAAPCVAGIGTDQRGFIRPDPGSVNLATPCDIGAVEINSKMDEIFANWFQP